MKINGEKMPEEKMSNILVFWGFFVFVFFWWHSCVSYVVSDL